MVVMLQPAAGSSASHGADFATFLADWQKLPPENPSAIQAKDFDLITSYVTPILSGGLGNIMYEIAAACTLAHSLSRPCLVGWWDQLRPGLEVEFRPYEGRPDPAPGISLKHIFPNLEFFDFSPDSYKEAGKEGGPDNFLWFRGAEFVLLIMQFLGYSALSDISQSPMI
jgi:hypothetical protein